MTVATTNGTSHLDHAKSGKPFGFDRGGEEKFDPSHSFFCGGGNTFGNVWHLYVSDLGAGMESLVAQSHEPRPSTQRETS